MDAMYLSSMKSPVNFGPDIAVLGFYITRSIVYDCSTNYTTGLRTNPMFMLSETILAATVEILRSISRGGLCIIFTAIALSIIMLFCHLSRDTVVCRRQRAARWTFS